MAKCTQLWPLHWYKLEKVVQNFLFYFCLCMRLLTISNRLTTPWLFNCTTGDERFNIAAAKRHRDSLPVNVKSATTTSHLKSMLKVLTIFQISFFPHLHIYRPLLGTNLYTKAVLQKIHGLCKRGKYLQFDLVYVGAQFNSGYHKSCKS